MSALNRIILAVGVVWACLTAAVGAVAVSAFHLVCVCSDNEKIIH